MTEGSSESSYELGSRCFRTIPRRGVVLTDSSHGSAYLSQFREGAQNRDLIFTDSRNTTAPVVDRARADVRLARLCRAEAAECRARKGAACAGVPAARAAAIGRRAWVVTAGRVGARTPCWRSRSGWLADVVAWADSPEGVAARQQVHVSRQLLASVVEAAAALADHETGRNLAAAFDTIASAAGCSRKSVQTALHLLADHAGLAVESFRGGRWDGRCRTSVWHLVSRPEPVDIFQSPPSRRDRRSVTVSNCVPSAASAAPRLKIPPIVDGAHRRQRKRRPPGAANISPEARRIGAWLAGHSQGMYHAPWRTDRDHSGGLAIALDRSGLDLTAWSGPTIAAAFDADMRQRGWYWPHRIEHPAAFLAARLRRLPERPDGPTRDGGYAAGRDRASGSTRSTPMPAPHVSEPPRPPLTDVQRARISAAQEGFRTHMAHRLQAAAPLPPPLGSVAVTATLAPAGDACSACGGSGGVVRPWLPLARRIVCKTCWDTAGQHTDHPSTPTRLTDTRRTR